MTWAVDEASNKPLERPAARIRSLAAAHWQRWADKHLHQTGKAQSLDSAVGYMTDSGEDRRDG